LVSAKDKVTHSRNIVRFNSGLFDTVVQNLSRYEIALHFIL